MRHRKHTFKINRTGSHRRAMMANMACSLLNPESKGQIKTTLVRAKELRRIVEKMITLGKRGSLHTRRQAIAYLRQPAIVRYLFDEVAPRYADRSGGYTRILKLGPRVGDGAEVCIVQLVSEPLEAKSATSGTPAATEEAPVTEEAVAETEVKAEAEEAEETVADETEEAAEEEEKAE